jgi:hypothetical protein
MVGLGRVELPTSPLSGVRSNQLSYRPGLAATPPDLTCIEEPGGSHKTSFRFKRVSRTRLNVLDGYAVRDHRANGNQAKKACIRIPALAVRDSHCRFDGHPYPTSRDVPHSQKGYERHRFSFRKEVIQPQVLLRLPCYDFTPIMNYTLGGCSLAVSSPTSSATHFRDVTGGVYKARERIHRGILIRDY